MAAGEGSHGPELTFAVPELTYAAPSAELKAYRTLPGRAARLEDALSGLGVPHDVKEYADAGHSFMNRINVGPVLAPVMRFVGLDYRHGSAEDAWRRILDFFDEHLGAPERD